jgi:hypothetical protein
MFLGAGGEDNRLVLQIHRQNRTETANYSSDVMGDLKYIVVDIPDVDYGLYVSKTLLPAAWLVTHQLFSVMRLEGQKRLSSVILRRLLGPRYNAIMAQLQAGGLLKLETDYSAGLHCREYRFLPPVSRFCFKTITDAKLVAAYARSKTNRKSKVHRWLDDILGDPALTFDEDKATAEVDGFTESEFNSLRKECSFEDWKTTLRRTIRRATNRQWAQTNQGRDLSTVDLFGGRYHHPFTSLPKSFRRFIRWSGQEVVNVDVRNSQPLFLCLVYEQEKGLQTPDWVRYRSLCEAGQLYESLNQRQIDRDAFKKRFFEEVLFGNVDSIGWSRFAQQFRAEFPTVFDFILSLKTPAASRQLKGDDKERPHRLAAKALQRAESNFMFNGVIAELKERGVKPVIPIHDSVLTTAQHAPTVASVIQEQFARKGFTCGVRTEAT